MVRIRRLLSCLFFSLLFFTPLFLMASKEVSAANAPDFHSSSLEAVTDDGAGQAPADGKTILKVTVTMKDASGNPLSGETVSLACPDDATLTITPSSATLGSDGRAIFSVTATNVSNYSIDAINRTQNVTLNSLGRVSFYSALCHDTPPGGAPKLISATALSGTKILLKWTQAPDPVTYYLLTYGTSSGQYHYGSANIGGHDATSYVVGELTPNKKYYFKIRAGNGCSPGAFSNEISGITVVATATPVPTPVSLVTSTPIAKENPVVKETPGPVINTPTPKAVIESSVTPLTLIVVVIAAGAILITVSLLFFLKRPRS
jgi:hypothetical protein